MAREEATYKERIDKANAELHKKEKKLAEEAEVQKKLFRDGCSKEFKDKAKN